jgi:flagellar assembly protein FliH
LNEVSGSIGRQPQPWPKRKIQDSDSEIELLISQAHKNGYSIGFKDGCLEEKKRIDDLANTVSEMLSNLEIFKAQILEQAEESIVKLVIALTRKIIFKEPFITEEVLLKIIQNSLSMVVDPTGLKIKVNPEDLKILNESKKSLEEIIGKSADISIESDTIILKGGCIIETDFGDIDARIEAQLEIMEKALLNELNLIVKKKQGDTWR